MQAHTGAMANRLLQRALLSRAKFRRLIMTGADHVYCSCRLLEIDQLQRVRPRHASAEQISFLNLISGRVDDCCSRVEHPGVQPAIANAPTSRARQLPTSVAIFQFARCSQARCTYELQVMLPLGIDVTWLVHAGCFCTSDLGHVNDGTMSGGLERRRTTEI